jgi:hypothetical protein
MLFPSGSISESPSERACIWIQTTSDGQRLHFSLQTFVHTQIVARQWSLIHWTGGVVGIQPGQDACLAEAMSLGVLHGFSHHMLTDWAEVSIELFDILDIKPLFIPQGQDEILFLLLQQ